MRCSVGLVVFLGLLLAAVGCSDSEPDETQNESQSQSKKSEPDKAELPPRVAFFGDSLSFEAERYYTAFITASGQTILTYNSLGGSATCDWLPKMREVAANQQPVAVELQFSGNNFTPCMEGFDPGTQPYYDKYRADTLEAISIFAPTGAHVYLIGAPVFRDKQFDPNRDRLNLQYAEIAAADPDHVTYVDAGVAVEGPGHTFTETLPCLPIEPCIGPVVDGVPSNTVRSPDGIHFCPSEVGDEEGQIARCATYSSGAFRFGFAMVQALAITPKT